MFGIGSLELLVIAVVTLLFVGPERLPEVMRAVVGTVQNLQDYWQQIYMEFKKESRLDELQQDLHNNKILSVEQEQKEKAAKDREQSD